MQTCRYAVISRQHPLGASTGCTARACRTSYYTTPHHQHEGAEGSGYQHIQPATLCSRMWHLGCMHADVEHSTPRHMQRCGGSSSTP